MKKIFAVLILFGALKVSAQIPAVPGFHNITMQHDSLSRIALVIVPQSYTPSQPASILFCFHGGTQTIQSFVFSQIDTIIGGGREELFAKADTENFILVFPQALVNNVSGSTLWNDKENFPQNDGDYDDMGFVLHLIDTVVQSFSVDTNKVYISGFSNGSDFAQFLAGQIPCKFAACVGIAGRTANQLSQQDTTLVFNPIALAPIPVMIVRGKLDPEVVYYGGINSNGTNTSSFFQDVDYWLNSNGCNSTNYTLWNMGDTVMVRTYASCNQNTQVKGVSLKYMSHHWPDANDNYFWNANTEVIDFCKNFTKTNCAFSSVIEQSLLNELYLFPNPTNGRFQIEFYDNKIHDLSLFNSTGQIIFRKKVAANDIIDLSQYGKGIFVILIDNNVIKKIIIN